MRLGPVIEWGRGIKGEGGLLEGNLGGVDMFLRVGYTGWLRPDLTHLCSGPFLRWLISNNRVPECEHYVSRGLELDLVFFIVSAVHLWCGPSLLSMHAVMKKCMPW